MASSSVPSGVWMLALLVLGSLLGVLGEPQAGGDWNSLSGMWGKRASNDWNRLSSMWGKRGPYVPYQEGGLHDLKGDSRDGSKKRRNLQPVCEWYDRNYWDSAAPADWLAPYTASPAEKMPYIGDAEEMP
ncbi:hypothetical protein HPB51_013584 [Rhipicephalus microplus]|uniref:Uncharacterized protein n=1 Tax=Rhipicephalus microplus TaxID=6941 RepID=A0A9J6DUM4_RHIMP|nr:hypothetical protein HPB51_013584 [Rhipicephalus microplus]